MGNSVAVIDVDLREGITAVLGVCLTKLVELGKVSTEELRERIVVDWTHSLSCERRGLAAAATADDARRAVLKLNTSIQLPGLIWAIPHEAVHIAQICRGDLVPMFGGNKWKGQTFRALHGEHPAYNDQPWEVEALELEEDVRNAVREKYPKLTEAWPTQN